MTSATLDSFTRNYHAHFCRDANARLQLGVDEALGELPNPSREWVDETVRSAAQLVGQADGLFDAPDLRDDESLDLALADLTLKSEMFRLTNRFNDRPLHEQLPVAGNDVGDGIFSLFVDKDLPATDRLEAITQRIERIPTYLAALLARLTVPVARWVEMDVEKVEGLPSLFSSVEALSRESKFADAARLTSACGAAIGALSEYVTKLRALPTTTNFALGQRGAERTIALRGIELGTDELHRLARDFLARNAEEVEALRRRLVRKYDQPEDLDAAGLMHFLQDRYRVTAAGDDFSSVLTRYREELDAIVAFIRERELFPIPSDQALEILRTPAFMAPSIPAGAMRSPPPFRQGVRRSLVYLTLSQELLAEHTELGIPLMMIHEGIPGHHLQLSSAAAHPSIIRRHTEAMDQAEGWTTMLEDYMVDAGYGASLEDEIRFMGKREIARIGARVAIDLCFMTGEKDYLDVGVNCSLDGEDAFAPAGNLLRTVTGFVPERVEAELNWYSQERGYPLSYLTGNHLVWQLFRDVRAAHSGSQEEADRAFFAAFLRAGNMPVAFLRRQFELDGLVK